MIFTLMLQKLNYSSLQPKKLLKNRKTLAAISVLRNFGETSKAAPKFLREKLQ